MICRGRLHPHQRSAKNAVITRLTFLLLCTWWLASCKDEKASPRDTNDSEIVPNIGSTSDFPTRNQIASEKVFSEDVLDSWGYLTTEVSERYHAIRSKKNYGNSDEAFYARFHLARAVFEDSAAATKAKNRIEASLKTSAGFKDYTQILQKDATLYSVSATSNYTYLSHQPKLLDSVQAYLTKNEEQGVVGQPATPPRVGD